MKTVQVFRGLKIVSAVLLMAVLGACSTVRTADSSVTSFAVKAVAVNAAVYRFEQLPSQSKDPLYGEIQAMAETALAEAGLKRDEAAARYTVEVSMVSEQYLRQPYVVLGRYSRFVMPSDRLFWSGYYPAMKDSVSYRYQLRLVMRDASTARVAYETTAELEVPWSDSINMIPALLKAALRDYPLPPTGTRKVQVELGQARASQP
jgi:Domain of unknown function (DUF4136)